MIINRRILLTVYTEEGFNVRIEGNGFNKKRPYKNYQTKDGIFRGRIPEQRNYTSHYKSRVRIQTLSATVVEYFQSKESKPIKKCPEHYNWYKMTPRQRLMWNLSQNAEGKKFEFSFF